MDQKENENKSILQRKGFSKIGKLSYLKGLQTKQIVKCYIEEVKQYTKKALHDIRKYIFCLQGMQRVASMTSNLKMYINHNFYPVETQFQCVLLRTCRGYHQTHIKKVASDISKFGYAQCTQKVCQDVKCEIFSDIILDALVHSYFFKVKNYENTTLVFKTMQIGSQAYRQMEQKQMYIQQNRTIVQTKGQQGTRKVIDLQILQIDVKDKRITNVSNTDLTKNIQQAINKQKIWKYEMRELNSLSYPLVSNLLCFSTFARIRNPLIHKLCRPSQHKNRLILYSFEHVYSEIYNNNKKKDKNGNTKKVKCLYNQCQNYFDAQNFKENAIIINSFKIPIYQELQQNLFGSYYSNIYQKNWHYDIAKTMLQNSDLQNRHLVQRYMPQIKSHVASLITNVNLEDAKKTIKKLYKKCKQEAGMKIKWAQFQNQQKIMIVSIGDFSLCPVRCVKCTNVNSLDAYKLSYLFLKNTDKKCPICDFENVQKKFYDAFYVDTELMRFLFFQGHAKEIYFDVKSKQFFHRLDYYTGISLKEKLKHQKKTTSENMHKYDMQVRLQKHKKYIPFIDRRCKQAIKDKPQQINKHYIYVVDAQKISENTKCSVCKKKIRVDQLQYNEQLQYILKNQKNQLKWSGSKDNEFYAKNKAIVSIKFYSEIQKQYSIKSQKGKFYWKNYQGTLIKYPFRFKKCEHPFQTTICDFGDILHQNRFEGATKFRCRYKECDLVYESAQDLQKLDMDIYKALNEVQEDMRDVIQNNKYWITFNFQTSEIQQISDKSNSQWTEDQQLLQIDKYRNKFLNSQQIQSKKEVLQRLNEVEKAIKLQRIKLKEDEQEINQNRPYKHSSSQQEFNNIKSNLRMLQMKKEDLQEIKRKLNARQQQQNRKKNNTSSINFNLLSKQYESQLTTLKEKKKIDEVNYSNIVNFEDFQLYGNIYPFLFEQPVFRNQNKVIQTASQLKIYLQSLDKQDKPNKKVYKNFNAEKMDKK